MAKSFYNKIKSAQNEKEVEIVYKNAIDDNFTNIKISHPNNCDGYFEQEILYDVERKVLRLLMEFKYDKDFNSSKSRAKVLVQIIYYLKRFRDNEGEYTAIPNIVLAGDEKTCFVLQGEKIYKYLEKKLDWSIAPSEAPANNIKLVEEIENDENIIPHIFNIDKNFRFFDVKKEISKLLFNIKIKYKITDLNMLKIYDYFIKNIVEKSNQYDSIFLVNTFINLIIDNKDVYQHPKVKGLLLTPEKKSIKIDNIRFKEFESLYANKYTISERKRILEYSDRLIEDTDRRKKGEFYTPTAWANRAGEKLSEVLGDNWVEEYLVWDCCWGTGNLTRDYFFNELYCSTLRSEDIQLGECNNPEAIKFQYDFLNDGIDKTTKDILTKEKIPKKLIKALKDNKKILFFINPPFGQASNSRSKGRAIKKDILNTQISELMKSDLIGNKNQIYSQFIYRILKIKEKYKLTNMALGIFLPPLFFTGSASEGLRKNFKNNFEFKDGFLFKASDFANVSNEWAISFSVWDSGSTLEESSLQFAIEEINKDNIIENIGKKKIYSLDKSKRLSSWIKLKNDKNKNKKSVMLKSGVGIENKTFNAQKNDLGYLINDSNNIYANTKGVYIINSKVKRHVKTTAIRKENFDKAVTIYAARAAIKSEWYTQIDEYCIPSERILQNEEWLGDALIYSIFSIKSNQSSLRNLIVDNESYNIFNEFFYISNKEVKNKADECSNSDLYNDASRFKGERFVYLKLNEMNLSIEAKSVLDKAKKLTLDSIKYREEFNTMHENNFINSWDAGWYQIKKLLKIYMSDELDEFNKLFNILEEKIVKNIYKFKILKN